jgi:large subunit ribosomal protein L4
MAEITVRNWENEEVRTLSLDDGVFDYPLKEHLIYEAVCAYRAAGRSGSHKVKNRKEVAGGTRKVWRQKGTGRARVGDNRSPLWRHGGTVHGPSPRDYSWGLPKKMKRNALKSALAQAHREGNLICVEAFDLESHKTHELENRLSKGLGIEGKVLFLSEDDNPKLERAARNNPRMTVVRALGASVVDLLAHETIVASEPALTKLTEVLAR